MSALCKKPVLHAFVQWPKELEITPGNEQFMLDHATAFMNKTLGGRAVFAARLDRDEKGQHGVDVFCTPIYDKKTKAGITAWVSTSKHLKALCPKHRDEITERCRHGYSNNMRARGIALQNEWREYLETLDLGFAIAPKVAKNGYRSDRTSPEVYGDLQDQKSELAAAQAQLTKDKKTLTHDQQALEKGQSELELDWIHARELAARAWDAQQILEVEAEIRNDHTE
jgi:hypothetical protein